MVLSISPTTRLWLGWWPALVAWFSHLLASFTLVDWYCQNDAALSPDRITLLLHLTTAGCLLLALAGLFAALGNARQTQARRVQGSGAPGRSTRRFLAVGGIGFSAFMMAVIALQGWSNFLLEPCA